MNQPQLGSFESIPLAAIRPSHTNPRKTFDQVALDELQRSIEEMGVNVPLLLRPMAKWTVEPMDEENGDHSWRISDGRGRSVRFASVDEADDAAIERNERDQEFEIVSGERRFRAALAAGLRSVPAIVRELTDDEALDIQMIENLQREDLHPVEEAEGYRALLAQGASPEDVAKKAGKTLAYVKQRIALLSLEVDAKRLFAEGHLTLGHALLLARLTPKDQERALRFMLRLEGDYAKMPFEKALQQREYNHENYTPDARMTDTTEAELKRWVESHVLLQLAGAPWDLADAELVPVAGACTTCPKRSGANAALFSDLTAEDDVCADPACFADKQKAYADRELERSKKAGTPLLKLSAKRSNEKLAQPVVELKPSAVKVEGAKAVETKRPVVVTKRPVKEGQWVASAEGECPKTVQGVVTDGPNRGTVQWVCADQNCKVHKHQVERPRPASSPSTSSRSHAEEMAKRGLEEKIGKAVDAALLSEIEKADAVEANMLAFFLGWFVAWDWQGDVVRLCEYLSIPVPTAKKQRNEYETHRQQSKLAEAAFANHVKQAELPELNDIAVALLVGQHAGASWMDDELLEKTAKALGVDVEGIQKQIREKAAADAEAAKVAQKSAEVSQVGQSAQKSKKTAANKRTSSGTAVDGKSAGAGAAAETAGE